MPPHKLLFITTILTISSLFSQTTGKIPLKEYLLGKYNPRENPSLFTLIPPHLSSKKIYLRKETLAAFKKMSQAAAREGIKLKVISGTRSYNSQRRIWDHKYKQKFKISHPDGKERTLKVLEFSSAPGTSRHHWGTDIDLNSVENYYFAKGYGKKVYTWLQKNSRRYGFYQAYDRDPDRTGYSEEKWHYTYLPLSKKFLKDYLRLISVRDLLGFAGDEYINKIDIIGSYVLGISRSIK